jgi:hypothetical protein
MHPPSPLSSRLCVYVGGLGQLYEAGSSSGGLLCLAPEEAALYTHLLEGVQADLWTGSLVGGVDYR